MGHIKNPDGWVSSYLGSCVEVFLLSMSASTVAVVGEGVEGDSEYGGGGLSPAPGGSSFREQL